MPRQIQMLRSRPRVLVGTPGRINDLLERGALMLHDSSTLVLDETDRMLDMGFGAQIDRIVKYLPQQRQTMMFSATLPQPIIKMSEKYLRNPQRIAVGTTNVPAKAIQQELIHTTQQDKYNELLKLLNTREGSIIVFVRTKWGAERLADRLCRQQHSADAIHGDLQQSRRERVITSFRNKRHRIMVATDIASRGLDIPHIEHVINYDLPQCPEDYIHRIGRTARAGAEGSAVSLLAPEDREKWQAIDRLLNPRPRGEGRPGNGHGHGSGDKPRKPNAQHRRRRRQHFRGQQGQQGGASAKAGNA